MIFQCTGVKFWGEIDISLAEHEPNFPYGRGARRAPRCPGFAITNKWKTIDGIIVLRFEIPDLCTNDTYDVE